ncbi:hypothetical protein OAQ84_00880 [Bdellovibrionales bacterium]|nr:hypothetical protein [Bdellovibrionales bacterium]
MKYIVLFLTTFLSQTSLSKYKTSSCDFKDVKSEACLEMQKGAPYLYTSSNGARVIPNYYTLIKDIFMKRIMGELKKSDLEPFSKYYEFNSKNSMDLEDNFEDFKAFAIKELSDAGVLNGNLKKKLQDLYLSSEYPSNIESKKYCDDLISATYEPVRNGIHLCFNEKNLPDEVYLRVLSHELCHAIGPATAKDIRILYKPSAGWKNSGFSLSNYVNWKKNKKLLNKYLKEGHIKKDMIDEPLPPKLQEINGCIDRFRKEFPSEVISKNQKKCKTISKGHRNSDQIKKCREYEESYNEEMFSDICGGELFNAYLNKSKNKKLINKKIYDKPWYLLPEMFAASCNRNHIPYHPPNEIRYGFLLSQDEVSRRYGCSPRKEVKCNWLKKEDLRTDQSQEASSGGIK